MAGGEIEMARLPLRALGLALLTLGITVSSCQALFHGVSLPSPGSLLEQYRD